MVLQLSKCHTLILVKVQGLMYSMQAHSQLDLDWQGYVSVSPSPSYDEKACYVGARRMVTLKGLATFLFHIKEKPVLKACKADIPKYAGENTMCACVHVCVPVSLCMLDLRVILHVNCYYYYGFQLTSK